jgi:hypothetical protein
LPGVVAALSVLALGATSVPVGKLSAVTGTLTFVNPSVNADASNALTATLLAASP